MEIEAKAQKRVDDLLRKQSAASLHSLPASLHSLPTVETDASQAGRQCADGGGGGGGGKGGGGGGGVEGGEGERRLGKKAD